MFTVIFNLNKNIFLENSVFPEPEYEKFIENQYYLWDYLTIIFTLGWFNMEVTFSTV